eukprot:gnl/TRDRNA2_/TRDRNA2_147845_c1_seq3.p1 gnl/TRDRNA2_/TRDRNA2_147845_c1~~gnl/TRDRNA2_/TRDRNA2_147845_c1_seq3.p1  ORF type:complete len:531 (+),score=83.52 gnl/TRDRNA2_/TRDRNA2_147845_c1_seq3:195-1595(+)
MNNKKQLHAQRSERQLNSLMAKSSQCEQIERKLEKTLDRVDALATQSREDLLNTNKMIANMHREMQMMQALLRSDLARASWNGRFSVNNDTAVPAKEHQKQSEEVHDMKIDNGISSNPMVTSAMQQEQQPLVEDCLVPGERFDKTDVPLWAEDLLREIKRIRIECVRLPDMARESLTEANGVSGFCREFAAALPECPTAVPNCNGHSSSLGDATPECHVAIPDFKSSSGTSTPRMSPAKKSKSGTKKLEKRSKSRDADAPVAWTRRRGNSPQRNRTRSPSRRRPKETRKRPGELQQRARTPESSKRTKLVERPAERQSSWRHEEQERNWRKRKMESTPMAVKAKRRAHQSGRVPPQLQIFAGGGTLTLTPRPGMPEDTVHEFDDGDMAVRRARGSDDQRKPRTPCKLTPAPTLATGKWRRSPSPRSPSPWSPKHRRQQEKRPLPGVSSAELLKKRDEREQKHRQQR